MGERNRARKREVDQLKQVTSYIFEIGSKFENLERVSGRLAAGWYKQTLAAQREGINWFVE